MTANEIQERIGVRTTHLMDKQAELVRLTEEVETVRKELADLRIAHQVLTGIEYEIAHAPMKAEG